MTEPSNTFKQAAYAQETEEVFIALITFDSDELTAPIYVSSDPTERLDDNGPIYGTTSNGTEFIFMPFDIWLPRDDKTGAVSAKIQIENVDRSIVEHLRSVRNAVGVRIQCVLSGDVDTIELDYNHFQLTNVQYDAMSITGDLTLNYWGLEPFPSYRFTPDGFPGLF